MLIQFTVENWRSFAEKTTFSMVASREQQHSARLSQIKSHRLRLLPVASIYGANASGKSNLVSAMAFARHLVTDLTKGLPVIPVEPFRLDQRYPQRPTSFSFEFMLADGRIMEYSFSVTRDRVVAETLAEVLTESDKVLFHREDGGSPEFHPSLPKDSRLDLIFKGTDRNQLFLNNTVSQRLDLFQPVFDWFKKSLVILGPESHPAPSLVLTEDWSNDILAELLRGLDTGIDCLGTEAVQPSEVGFPQEFLDQVGKHLPEGGVTGFGGLGPLGSMFVTRKQGQVELLHRFARHTDSSGNPVQFDLADESDGSLRLIDLLPVMLATAARGSDITLVVDEIDRSLHTLLVRKLLDWYLGSRTDANRSQLIFTTHDVLLMDQTLLRRDEMWLTDRDGRGMSSLTPLSDFGADIRKDKDIRKSYLQGRLGGIPQILLDVTLGRSPDSEEAS